LNKNNPLLSPKYKDLVEDTNEMQQMMYQLDRQDEIHSSKAHTQKIPEDQQTQNTGAFKMQPSQFQL